MSKPSVIAFVQARLTSTRLPNKVLAQIGKYSVLELMTRRLARAKAIDEIVFVIPDTISNDPLAEYIATNLKAPLMRGSEDDVLTRFIKAIEKYRADYYVRLTADCPLISPEIVDEVINVTLAEKASYGSNTNPPTFPDGFDVECISREALEWTDKNITDQKIREHVTLGLRQTGKKDPSFKFVNVEHDSPTMEWMRMTLDSPEDLNVFRELDRMFSPSLELANHTELEKAYAELNLDKFNGKLTRNAAIKNLS